MIKTGEAGINWSSFKECADTKKVVWIEDGVETEIGFTTEEVRIDEDKNLLHRKQELAFFDRNKPNRIATVMLQHSTFEPISSSDQGPKAIHVNYSPNKMETRFEDEGIERSIILPKEEGLFDLFSIELLLRLLPLKLGYQNELRAFIHMTNDIRTVKMEVVGSQDIFDGHEKVDAWCVKVALGANLQTYWISKESKELLKQSIQIGEKVFLEFIR